MQLSIYSRAANIPAQLDRKSRDTARNTRGRICPVQISVFIQGICFPEPHRKIREQRVKTVQTSSCKQDVVRQANFKMLS